MTIPWLFRFINYKWKSIHHSKNALLSVIVVLFLSFSFNSFVLKISILLLLLVLFLTLFLFLCLFFQSKFKAKSFITCFLISIETKSNLCCYMILKHVHLSLFALCYGERWRIEEQKKKERKRKIRNRQLRIKERRLVS